NSNKLITMRKISFIFLVFAFISCHQDSLFIHEKTDIPSEVKIDEDGVIHVVIKPDVNYRTSDTLCYLYEALRFIESHPTCPDQADQGSRIRVNTKLRLVKVSKQTSQITPITEWTTFNNVGGLNISWYLHPPLQDYWYATQFEYCYKSSSVNEVFWLLDFWGDDGMRVHTDPFNAYDVKGCTSAPISQEHIVIKCTLNSDCSITE
ncbi:MAG: hypothetical protein NZ529_11345, partial [Cytophagaceae bacterium]|nr:hypothetical protein [Cytophagaceae bacterium]MDW8457379.1 hypothetical protein [Cytophagaceae bacterium]